MAVLMMMEGVELADHLREDLLRTHRLLGVNRAGIELVPRVEEPDKVHEFGNQTRRGQLRQHVLVLTNSYEHVEESWRGQKGLQAHIHKATVGVIREALGEDFVNIS